MTSSKNDRSWPKAVVNGLSRRCPCCGEGDIFEGYLRVRDQCEQCGLMLSGHRADDLPPYLTIFAAGHLLIPLVLFTENMFEPSVLTSTIIWCAAALALCLYLLPRFKGAVIGLQWANRMHGFDDSKRPFQPDRPGPIN